MAYYPQFQNSAIAMFGGRTVRIREIGEEMGYQVGVVVPKLSAGLAVVNAAEVTTIQQTMTTSLKKTRSSVVGPRR